MTTMIIHDYRNNVYIIHGPPPFPYISQYASWADDVTMLLSSSQLNMGTAVHVMHTKLLSNTPVAS